MLLLDEKNIFPMVVLTVVMVDVAVMLFFASREI